ncbi:MAG TPA: DUF192 domain-containing protein [Anaeromyxobacteraceae bacterium]|nr:DUF192 domain-containing protein [Anaeromyxobacteraceae bacterium]
MSGARPWRAAAAAAFAALLACPSSRSAGGGPPGAPQVVVESGGKARAVVVEVAADPASRERGLMFREKLEDGRGMLFVFEEEAEHSFWMKNTLVSLDLIFVSGEGRVVGLVSRAEPLSLAPLTGGRCRYVLEVPAGWAEARGVARGDRVRFENVPLRRFE